MYRRFFIPALVLTCTLFLLTSCKKDEVQARESIEGDWEVTAITSMYGEFFNGSFSSSQNLTESGQLGTFSFTESTVEYSFTRQDTVYSGNGAWTLELERVNSGFTRVNQSTLTLANDYVFDVTFEDGTKNSEKKAEYLSLMEIASQDSGAGIMIQLNLDKR